MAINSNYTRGKYDSNINGKAYNDYVRKINKKVSTVEEAIEETKNILGIEEIDGVQFSDEFWSDVFTQQDDKEELGCVKLCINTSETLYSDLMISKSLEAFGSLILDKDERGLYDTENKKIRLYNSQEEFDKAQREERKNYLLAMKNGGESINIADSNQEFAMLSIPKNYKKVKTFDLSNINAVDKEFGKDYPVIHDYCEGYKKLNEKRKQIKELLNDTETENKKELLNSVKAICRQLGEIKKDLNTALKELVRPIMWKQPLKDNGEADYNHFDFFDKKQVKELLKVKKDKHDFQNDLSCILYDLEVLLSKCTFTDNQKKILDMFRNGATQQKIADTMGVTKQRINVAINTIVNNIVNEYEKEYMDWYYLNKVKGTYKKCTKCGEIKLIQEFGTLKSSKDGHRDVCKECRKIYEF